MNTCERCGEEYEGYTRKHNHQVVCPKCFNLIHINASEGAPAIKTDSWVEGMWEHIDKEPIYIRDKKHLYEECRKRGHLPKAFMKPSSQGKGHEFKWR